MKTGSRPNEFSRKPGGGFSKYLSVITFHRRFPPGQGKVSAIPAGEKEMGLLPQGSFYLYNRPLNRFAGISALKPTPSRFLSSLFLPSQTHKKPAV